jgi:hypothetical protein
MTIRHQYPAPPPQTSRDGISSVPNPTQQIHPHSIGKKDDRK